MHYLSWKLESTSETRSRNSQKRFRLKRLFILPVKSLLKILFNAQEHRAVMRAIKLVVVGNGAVGKVKLALNWNASYLLSTICN